METAKVPKKKRLHCGVLGNDTNEVTKVTAMKLGSIENQESAAITVQPRDLVKRQS